MPDDLRTELVRLDEEERAISARRRRLHDRIDFLRATGGDPDRLEELLHEEREVSTARRALHARIDALRVQLDLMPGPLTRHPRPD